MIDLQLIRQNFGDLWPTHNQAFNELLIGCRRAFDGDLDKMLILSVIGERSFSSERGQGLSYDDFRNRKHIERAWKPINIQSISDCTGIPRETTRRKVEQLVTRGWLERDPCGTLRVAPAAAEELRPLTEFTMVYLQAIGTRLARIGAS